MGEFTVERRTTLSAQETFARVTDWASHRPPLTRVSVTSPHPDGIGTTFVARTALGRWGYDDDMQVVRWRPPSGQEAGHCRIEKVGRVLAGWAEISVRPVHGGSVLTWHEVASFRGVGRLLDWPTALGGRIIFGRLIDKLLSD